MRVFRKTERSLREAGRSLGKLREVYFKMKFKKNWEKFGQTQRSLFENERSLRKTYRSSAKLREVTTVFFFISGEVYIKMRVFRKTERSLREAGRSLGKLREVYFKMREV